MKRMVAAITLTAASLLGACGGGSGGSGAVTTSGQQDVECEPNQGCEVTQEQFGDEWPFTVGSGTLSCEIVDATRNPPTGSVLFEANGTVYAVNGIAKNQATEKGWHPLEEIWADNPATAQYGGKIGIQPMIGLGLGICA